MVNLMLLKGKARARPGRPSRPASRVSSPNGRHLLWRPTHRAMLTLNGRAMPSLGPLKASSSDPAPNPLECAEDVQARDPRRWERLREALEGKLLEDEGGDASRFQERIEKYYLPVYLWVREKLKRHRKAEATAGEAKASPLFVGLSAPQGCGKTTLVDSIEFLFDCDDGATCVAASLDDFYLTFQEQQELSSTTAAGNALLSGRGNAGTHDVPLCLETLAALKRFNAEGEGGVSVPKYDKTQNGGRGDRAPDSDWRQLQPGSMPSIDCVVFEGWMNGFEAVGAEDEAKLSGIHPGLEQVNALMKQYKQVWQQMDCWMVIRIEDCNWVFEWRKEAEVRMKQRTGKGMTDEELRAFVEMYIPAYQAFLPKLYSRGPPLRKGAEGSTLADDRVLVFDVDFARRPTFQAARTQA